MICSFSCPSRRICTSRLKFLETRQPDWQINNKNICSTMKLFENFNSFLCFITLIFIQSSDPTFRTCSTQVTCCSMFKLQLNDRRWIKMKQNRTVIHKPWNSHLTSLVSSNQKDINMTENESWTEEAHKRHLQLPKFNFRFADSTLAHWTHASVLVEKTLETLQSPNTKLKAK